MTSVEWVTDDAAFAALEDEWERLAEHARMPFVRHGWLTAWWAAYGAGSTLAVCTVRAGGELRAAFPLHRRGGTLAAMANEHSPSYRPLAVDAEALRTVVDAVVDAAPGTLAVPLPEEDPALPLLRDASARAGRGFWAEPTVRSPYIEATGTFADYRTLIGKNGRKESERRTRRLLEDGGVVEALVVPRDVQAELTTGLELEASGWKARRGTAILNSEADTRFYRLLADWLHAEGRLVFSWIHHGGRPVAFTYNILDHGRVWSLKFGMDDATKHLAPGIVATYADVREVYERGLDAYELLGDFEPWKQRFAKVARDHVRVHSYRRAAVPAARVAYRRHLRPRLKVVYGRLQGLRR